MRLQVVFRKLFLTRHPAKFCALSLVSSKLAWHAGEHAPEYTNDETLSQHDETSCTIMSMNTRIGGFPDDVAKWCLLIYNSSSLGSEDEGGRIAMLGRPVLY